MRKINPIEVLDLEPVGFAQPCTLLFVHGAYHDAWAFRDVLMPYFADHGYASRALSLRGHGGSTGHEQVHKARFEEYIEDVRQVVADTEGPLVLIGHSTGGMLVRKILEEQAFAGAVLMATPNSHDLLRSTFPILKNHGWAALKMLLTGNPDHLFHNREEARGLFFAGDRSPAAECALDRIVNQSESPIAYKQLLSVKVASPRHSTPVLVVGGDADLSVPVKSVHAMAKFYDGEARIYPGRPHGLFVPPGWEPMAQDMLQWMNRLARVAAA